MKDNLMGAKPLASFGIVATMVFGSIGANAGPESLASNALSIKPDALLQIDLNRTAVVERIVESWKGEIPAAQIGAFRGKLMGLRADHLLAANLSGSFDSVLETLQQHETASKPSMSNLLDAVGSRNVLDTAKAVGEVDRDLVYTPIAPCNLMDTRPGVSPVPPEGGPALNAGYGIRVVQITGRCGIPAGAKAVASLFTVENIPSTGGVVFAGDAGGAGGAVASWSAPANYASGSSLVPLSAAGAMQLQSAGATQIKIDVNGYFMPANRNGDGLRVIQNAGTYVSTINGASSNVANQPAASVAGGANNQATAFGAGVAGGFNNQATSNYSAIVGGSDNVAGGGGSSFVGGGASNTIAVAGYSVIGGGRNNSIAGGAISSIVGGYGGSNSGFSSFMGSGGSGTGNTCYDYASTTSIARCYNEITITAFNSALTGGFNNTISSSSGFIGAGGANVVSQNEGSVVSGNRNTVAAYNGFIGAGDQNSVPANANSSAVVAGSLNVASGSAAFVGAGRENTASGLRSFIGGGFGNVASGERAVIGGGGSNYEPIAGATDGCFNRTTNAFDGTCRNRAEGRRDFIGAGTGNRAANNESTVVGGTSNEASASQSFVGGGLGNTAAGAFSAIAGGLRNHASGGLSFAGGRGARTDDVAGTTNYYGAFVWADTIDQGLAASLIANTQPFRATANNQFAARARGGVVFNVNNVTIAGSAADAGKCELLPGGSPSWSCTSDRNTKEAFTKVSARDVLNKVVAMPLMSWSYKGVNRKHISPMAQDFWNAFGLGADDKSITSSDVSGIALAAIQGMNQKLTAESNAKDAKISSQGEKLSAQGEKISTLERELAAIKKKLGL